jgi:hypothetical protein
MTVATQPVRSRYARRRLLIIAVVGAVVIITTAFFVQFWFVRPIGSGPAGPMVDRAAFERPWTERRVLLLGVGDSVTAGLGAASADHSYFARLATNPKDEFSEMKGLCLSAVIPNLKTKNIAQSGSTSLAHWNRIKDLPPFDPDVLGLVVLTTGGNDLIHNYGRTPPREGAMYGARLSEAQPWIENFEQRLHEMLDMLEERFPGGCLVFLADIYDPTDGVGDAPSVYLPHWRDGLAIHREYNAVIHRCADERRNVFLVPLYETFLGHGSHCRQFWRSTYCRQDPHYWFYDNIEDPNDRGYDAIRRVFLNSIAAEREETEKRVVE